MSERPITVEYIMIGGLFQFSWRRGFEDSRGQGFKRLFSINFISAFDPSFNFQGIHSKPWILDPLNRQQRSHSPLLAAGNASEYENDRIPYREDSLQLVAGYSSILLKSSIG